MGEPDTPHPKPGPQAQSCATLTKCRETLHHRNSGVEPLPAQLRGLCTQPGGIKMMILQSQKVSHEFIWSERGRLKTGKSVQTHLTDSAKRRGVNVFNVTVSPACVFYCYPTEKKSHNHKHALKHHVTQPTNPVCKILFLLVVTYLCMHRHVWVCVCV